MSTTSLKLGSLVVRTLAKPIATQIKGQARDHPQFRKVCITIAQQIHQVDMRLRLGLLRDTTANLVKAEQREKERRRQETLERIKESQITSTGDSARVRSDVKTDDAEKEAKEKEEREQAKEVSKLPRIRPLSEAKAIDAGANFISEAFLFGVAVSLLLFEQLRSRRKEATRRDVVQERITLLEERNRQDGERLEELEVRDILQTKRVKELEEISWKLQGNKDEWPGKKEPVVFRKWKPKPLWVEEEKAERGFWSSLWPWAIETKSSDQVEKGEMATSKKD